MRKQPKGNRKTKTRRAAVKRFHITGTGKIVRHKANHRHILTKKTTKRKRGLRSGVLVSPEETKTVRLMLLGS